MLKCTLNHDVTNNYFIMPGHRPTIDRSCCPARDGDNIILLPGTHVISSPYGIDTMGKKLHITSIRPYDQDAVDRTIINCSGQAIGRKEHFGSTTVKPIRSSMELRSKWLCCR